MRWEDERYVRIFTRDTAEWIALGWEAQSLFTAILRKVDRAGILTLGKTGARGLAGVVRFPVEVVERALPILLEDGCIKQGDGALVVPNFILAQETPQSDKARQREKRERDRIRVMDEARVTKRDDESQNVTESHAESRRVTPSHAESLLAVPSRAEPESGGSAREGLPSAEGPDLIAFASELAAEEQASGTSGVGTSVAERVAQCRKPSIGQLTALRKIYDSRVTRVNQGPPSPPPLSVDERWVAERWQEARRRKNLPDGDPEPRHVVALWTKASKASMGAKPAHGWKPTPREIVAFWIRSYLDDGQSHAGGIVDQRHPLALLVARAGESYGLPLPPAHAAHVAVGHEPPPLRREPPPDDIRALTSATLAAMGTGDQMTKRRGDR